MAGSMKDSKGRPTRLALALKAWGFSSKEQARAFANKHKKSQEQEMPGMKMYMKKMTMKKGAKKKGKKKKGMSYGGKKK